MAFEAEDIHHRHQNERSGIELESVLEDQGTDDAGAVELVAVESAGKKDRWPRPPPTLDADRDGYRAPGVALADLEMDIPALAQADSSATELEVFFLRKGDHR